MAVTIDLLEGSPASHDLMRGWDLTRIAIVTGLQAACTATISGITTSGIADVATADTTLLFVGESVSGVGIPPATKIVGITPATKITLSNAATADGTVTLTCGGSDTAGLINCAECGVIEVTGDRGSACPNIGVPTFLQTFHTELISDNAAKVKILYKGYPVAVYEFDGSLNQIETNLDINGQPITVEYTYPNPYPPNPDLAGLTVTQGGLVSRAVPEAVFIIRFIVVKVGSDSASTLVAALKADNEGYINNAQFAICGLMGAKHTWLCEKVSAVSRDGGISYEVAMHYHYKGNTWDPLVTFIKPDDGKPPPVVTAGTEYKLVQVLPEAPFSLPYLGPN